MSQQQDVEILVSETDGNGFLRCVFFCDFAYCIGIRVCTRVCVCMCVCVFSRCRLFSFMVFFI